MKKRIILLGVFILLLAYAGYAQEAVAYQVHFEEASVVLKGAFLSDTIKIERDQGNLPFVGISAYCKNVSVEANLFYRMWADQKWSEWIPFSKFTEGQLTDRVAYEGPPILQKIQAVQFKSDRQVSTEMTFRLYFPDPVKKKITSATEINPLNISTIEALACTCAQPSFCNRNCWCPSGNCPPDPTPVSTTPTHIIIHHSAGFNSSTNFPAVVAYYWDLHVNTNGWDDIGYNWLMDAEGTIYEGRGDKRLGAHFSCMNGNTLGICMIGDFQNVAPTEIAIAQLKDWLAWESCSKDIKLTENREHLPSQSNLRHVSGHRDGNTSTAPNSCARGTVCPGGRLYEQLDAFAREVADYACLSPAPDLVIRDMWTEPSDPLAGDTVDLYVSFKNVGVVPAQNIRWDFQIGEEKVGSDSLNVLAVDETQVRFLNNYVFPAAGNYAYCINADAVAEEANSANNSFCRDILVSGATVLQEIDIVDRFVAYPNPGHGLFKVEVVYKMAPKDYVLQVINALGQVIYTQREAALYSRELDVSLDLRVLAPGNYFLNIRSDQGSVVRRLVVLGNE